VIVVDSALAVPLHPTPVYKDPANVYPSLRCKLHVHIVQADAMLPRIPNRLWFQIVVRVDKLEIWWVGIIIIIILPKSFNLAVMQLINVLAKNWL
jgi:hypothetical protein